LERSNIPHPSSTACGNKAKLFHLLLLDEEKPLNSKEKNWENILLSDKMQDVILSYTQSCKETRSEAEVKSEEEEGKKMIPRIKREGGERRSCSQTSYGKSNPSGEDYPFLNNF
jgi:hypothetical protein